MNAPVRITGLGFICSLGNSSEEVLHNLREGVSGLGPFPHRWSTQSPVTVAGTLRGYDFTRTDRRQWIYPESPAMPRTFLRNAAPHGIMAYHALTQALADAQISTNSETIARAGLYCASAGSAMMLHHYVDEMKDSSGRRVNPSGVLSSIAGTLNFSLGAAFGIQGANCGFVSACTSSAHALGYAVDDLRLGRTETALVVAAEDLNAESLLPFAGMRALSEGRDSRASRPFDEHRNGFVPTGGAVALILQRDADGESYAKVTGWAQSADGFDSAVPDPDGAGLYRAMQGALHEAGLKPNQLDYINAHATSTRRGDISEARALLRLLGPHTPKVPVSSTKGITGHSLSMAGALECAFCALMIRHGFIPGNPHLDNPDPEVRSLNLPRSTLARCPRSILSNSSGFGGSNVCLILRE